MSLTLVSTEPRASDLRRELADAIANRNAAEARVRIAQDTFDAANRALHESAHHAQRLKADLDTHQRVATERAAKRFEEALRAGSDLPDTHGRQSRPITPP